MVIEGALPLQKRRNRGKRTERIPSTDGDTGTNMSMTMGSAMAEIKTRRADLAKAADATASRAAARRARQLGCYPVAAVPQPLAKKLRKTGN